MNKKIWFRRVNYTGKTNGEVYISYAKGRLITIRGRTMVSRKDMLHDYITGTCCNLKDIRYINILDFNQIKKKMITKRLTKGVNNKNIMRIGG